MKAQEIQGVPFPPMKAEREGMVATFLLQRGSRERLVVSRSGGSKQERPTLVWTNEKGEIDSS